jgi:ABC-type branched-subunit amino acid transport system substrate-binding protein
MLAVEKHRANPENAPVEIVVVDDSSRVETAIRYVERLEDGEVAAVLGPVRTEALASAAIRRDDQDLLVLSPTASSAPQGEMNAYTLWDRERREEDTAIALISWMIDEMDLQTFGVLYPEGWSAGALEALVERAAELGAAVTVSRSYAADSTTFGEPITALAEAEPAAVLVFADRPRTVLQLAPQLVYYGLRRWVTGGDANWSDPAVIRRLEASYADHRLVALFVDRLDPESTWSVFKAQYEAEYRKAFDENMFAALGYDAMSLILKGLPEAEVQRRGAVGRAIRRGAHAGATGEVSADPETGGLRRDVFVRVIREGELHVPDPAEMLDWAAEQLELEEFLRALEEEEEKEQEENGP